MGHDPRKANLFVSVVYPQTIRPTIVVNLSKKGLLMILAYSKLGTDRGLEDQAP